MRKRKTVAVVVAVTLAGWALACEPGIPAGREPQREFNFTDMGDQPKLKPQRGVLTVGEEPTGLGMLTPPLGSVAVGEYPYRFTQKQADLAAKAAQNPLPASVEVLKKGEWVYTNFCIVCHGPEGAGDGEVTQLFPAPPSLMRQKPRDYTDARVAHVPWRGQGSMPSYANQIDPDEIWSVVHYIRSLQAKFPVAPPTKDDLKGAGTAAADPGGAAAGE